MPRTKRAASRKDSESKKTKENAKSSQVDIMYVQDIEEQFAVKLKGFNENHLLRVNNIMSVFNVSVMHVGQDFLDKVPQSSLSKGEEPESSLEVTSSSYDSMDTFKMPTTTCRERLPVSRPLADRFRTPNCNIAPGGNRYNMITPKVAPNCPMSILRRPQEGEMAFAMTGSPLLVSSKGTDEMANVNVPLGDGKVLSILPQSGMRPEQMPTMGPDTMAQLLRLRENIDCILNNN